ncbi:hypothetical protein, partial [Salipiger sp. HF18]|uniref:hypothetical protein n=1 Tax=Salipiger sp. HF18 TaxID=2721557 RepID=UPI001C37DC5A
MAVVRPGADPIARWQRHFAPRAAFVLPADRSPRIRLSMRPDTVPGRPEFIAMLAMLFATIAFSI